MCLRVDKSVRITQDKVWKVLRVTPRGLESVIYVFDWRPGWNVQHHYGPMSNDAMIRSGLHVFLNKEDAVTYRDRLKQNMPEEQNIHKGVFAVVELTFNWSDVIGVGKHAGEPIEQAVFKRLYLSQEEYNRAIEGNYVPD